MKRFALILVAALSPLSAQQTWHGLVFGSSEQECQKILGSEFKIEAKAESDRNGETRPLSPLWTIRGKTHPVTYSFLPELHFRMVHNSAQEGEVSSLDMVTVKLVIPDEYMQNGSKTLAYITTASDEMLDGLRNKYGAPQEIKGTCPITVSQVIRGGSMGSHECTATWRAENQVISLENALFLIPNQKPDMFFWIQYRSAKSDF